MKIVVCIKQVPDTATRIKIKQGSSSIETEGVQYVVNPYDEYAVEEALRIKERIGDSEITILSMGPDRTKEAIKTCLAMGADKAIHLIDDRFEGSDSYATSLILAKGLRDIGYDLILCGKQGVDDDAAQVGPSIAEMLNIPHVSVITRLDLYDDNKKVIIHREVEYGTEVIETTLPALLTCQKGLNEPRLPSLKGIMSAKKKEIRKVNSDALGLSHKEIGLQGSKTKVIALSLPPQRKGGRIIKGEPQEGVKELVRLLREEAKVI
ncbi:MAG: electron transfer flavoprotein subunit beta/FixA family protein [Nitrospinae bacterium]|nr:electron transfer flavoprotein subunit beta/FixA family protein [Nitrospinota bacterium]